MRPVARRSSEARVQRTCPGQRPGIEKVVEVVDGDTLTVLRGKTQVRVRLDPHLAPGASTENQTTHGCDLRHLVKEEGPPARLTAARR